MKVEYWSLGKTDEAYLKEGMDKYLKKLQPYLSFEYREIVPSRSRKATDPSQHQLIEKEEILKLLKSQDHLILLDELGERFTSVNFAGFLRKKFNSLQGNLIFLSGGPYGFHEEVYQRSNGKIALSEMTFTHQMVRLIFLEQLYRAMTILRNEPYHH